MIDETVKIDGLTAKSSSILDYLKEDCIISIPRYQREYSWEKENVLTLINDFKENYYIGNVIVYMKSDSGVKEIIDGQQRLITIFLILISIYKNTTNSELKLELEKIILNSSNEIKLNLSQRLANDGREIIKFIFEGENSTPRVSSKYNEIGMYEYINSIVKQQGNLEEFFLRIKKSTLVEIAFNDYEFLAHEMFVNINTKGKKLSEIEVLKSQLFKYLIPSSSADSYKERWQEMLEEIPSKEYDDYVSDTFLFQVFKNSTDNDQIKTNGTITENYFALLKMIDSKDSAKKVFNFMTGNSIGEIFRVYSAVKNYDLDMLATNYYSQRINDTTLDKVNQIWKIYGELGFKQSDILMISLLMDKESFVISNTGYLLTFMKYILMYELSRSVSKNSPAQYANIFKQVSAKLYGVKDPSQIKLILKEFIKDLTVNKADVRSKIVSPNTFSKSHKNAKFIIMMAEDFYTHKLKLEHFIHQKTQNTEEKRHVNFIGNFIPVIKDRYKNKSVAQKLVMYHEDKHSDDGILNFINYGIDESNYISKVIERGDKIADTFLEKMADYRKRILED